MKKHPPHYCLVYVHPYSRLFIQTYHTVADVYIRFIPDLLYNKNCTSETHSRLLRRKTMRERGANERR